MRVKIIVPAGLNKIRIISGIFIPKFFVKVQLNNTPHYFQSWCDKFKGIDPVFVAHYNGQFIENFIRRQMTIKLKALAFRVVDVRHHGACKGTLHKLTKFWSQFFNTKVGFKLLTDFLINPYQFKEIFVVPYHEYH